MFVGCCAGFCMIVKQKFNSRQHSQARRESACLHQFLFRLTGCQYT
ncbi:hypothetical protein EVA_11972 [gut metagenome]|uniref:Uncharacterized protein n=1 Tax=gut metagenome TaxID=749906 RepID=J9FZB4_9ZZZZ